MEIRGEVGELEGQNGLDWNLTDVPDGHGPHAGKKLKPILCVPAVGMRGEGIGAKGRGMREKSSERNDVDAVGPRRALIRVSGCIEMLDMRVQSSHYLKVDLLVFLVRDKNVICGESLDRIPRTN